MTRDLYFECLSLEKLLILEERRGQACSQVMCLRGVTICEKAKREESFREEFWPWCCHACLAGLRLPTLILRALPVIMNITSDNGRMYISYVRCIFKK